MHSDDVVANLENEARGIRLAIAAQRELEAERFLAALETSPLQTSERVVELRRLRRGI